MNYCESFCRTIQRLCNTGEGGIVLPNDYQRVEYLQSSGSQYIRTGIYNSTPLDFYCKYEALAYNSNNYIFGSWNGLGRCFVSYNSTGLQWLGYRDSSYSGGTMVLNSVCELTGALKPGVQNLYKDGVLQSSGTNAAAITRDDNIYLFAGLSRAYGDGIVENFITGRIYRFTFWSNGAKILDYVPCYRKSDNKPGMYDLVSQSFLTNAGQGEFTVGNNV